MLGEAMASSHEEYHWKQHHGSTWGAFLSLLKFVRESITVDMFRAANPRHLKAYFEQRSREDGLPLIGRSGDGNFAFPNEVRVDSALNFLSLEARQFLITESLFNDPQLWVSTAGMTSYESAISQSMEDATHSIIDRFGISVAHQEIVSAYELAPGSLDLAKTRDDRPLTVHAIAEGAATIQEFMVNVAGVRSFEREMQIYTLDGKRLAEKAGTPLLRAMSPQD
jgi:hypothetical protein